jgi:hypothetical protein
MSPRHLLCTLLLPLVAACGGGDSTTIDKSQFGASFAKAYCTSVFACCAGTPTSLTEASCEGNVGAVLQGSLNSALTKSTQTYHSDNAAACIAQFTASNCGAVVVGTQSTSCNSVVTGNVALGGSCSNTDDCAPGGFCVVPNNSSTGACTAQVQTGGACYQPNNASSTGNFCAGNGHISTHFASDAGCVCAAPKANGAACDGANGINSDCASNYCGANGTCVQPTAVPAALCSQVLSN